MKLRLRKLNEETRTVSGFTEFTHNGKNSLMETDDTPSGAASFFKGKYSTEFFATNKSINDVYEYTKNKSSIVYNSLTNFYNEHKQLLTTDKSKSLKTILVTINNENKERELLAVAAYILKKEDNAVSHILVSDINFNEQKSKEIYGYIKKGFPVIVYNLAGTESPKGIAMDEAYAMDQAITAIGTVGLESEAAITACRTQYDALSDMAKAYVKKYQILMN